MNSGKSERKSRRSSILKIPKPRQPLQNVELSPSSIENSPATSTTKVKRRVSFAEKKHVKEFCDSIEQGTVWDNTYEESELSQMRNSQNSNNDENAVDIVGRSNDPSIQQDAIHLRSVDEKRGSEINLTRNKNKYSSDPKSSISLIDFQSENKENAKVMKDDDANAMESDLDLTDTVETVVHPEKPLQISQHDKIIIFHDSFNAAQPEVLTKFSKIHESTEKQSMGASEKNTIFEKRTTNFPNDASNDRGVSDSSLNEYDRNEPKIITEKTTGIFNKSMDFTEVVKNMMTIDEPQKTSVERTTIFHNTSVEFTNIVQNIQCIEKSPNPPLDRSILYRNDTVDFTEVVQDIQSIEKSQKLSPEKTTIFHNKSVDFTEVVQNIQSIEKSQKLSPEKTTIFHNKSVDFTEVVQNIQSIEKSQKLSPEKTTIFHNKSVDFTEVVQNIPSIEKSQKLSPEKTTIFHNKSVDFTEVVQNIQSIEKSQKLSPEKTTIFHDKSVDFTEVVLNIQSIEKSQKLSPEKTMIFHNKSVDFTEVVQNIQSIEKSQKLSPEKTTIFHDKSVDFTEVVQNIQSIEKSQKLSPEKTTIFHNKSVDFTEVVQNIQSIEKSQKLSPEKTTIFHNKSVDFTEVVQNIQRIEKSQKLSPEKATIFHNKSVDFTEVVQNSINIEPTPKSQPGKSTIFHDEFVDFTEIVPNIPSREKQFLDKSENHYEPEERTLLQDQSMKLTEIVSQIPSVSKKPFGFSDQSSMRDKVVPTSLSSEVILDNRMDFDDEENVDGRLEAMDSTVLHDESMEITRAIPSLLQSRKNGVKETSGIIVFCDKFVTPTKSLSLPQSLEMLPLSRESPECNTKINSPLMAEEKTMIFRDASMELTSAVSLQTMNNDRSNEQEHGKCELNNFLELEKEDKTVVFHDDSMEITRAVKSSLKSKKMTILDKENCPISMEDLLPSSNKSLGNEHRIELPQSKLIEMIKPVKFSSLPGNEENAMDLSESEEQHRVYSFESNDISGVVPLSTETENLNSGSRDLQFSEKTDEIVALSGEKIQFNEEIPQVSVLNENRIQFPRTDPPPEEMEIVHTGEKSYQCLSQQANEFFQKSMTNLEYIERKDDKIDVNDKDGLERTNLHDEIRQLAETFSLSDSNGFDQATFLRQQASCLKDHEANSIASQEFSSRTFSTNRDRARGDSHEPGKSHCVRNSIVIEKPELPTNDMIFSSESKDTESKNATINERHDYSSTMERGTYDKSLEELRSRAYSVRKFRPENTICELTEGLMVGHPGYFHDTVMLEDLQAEEPPSFVFAESLTKDPVDNVDSASGSRIEVQCGIGRENIRSQSSLKERGALCDSQLMEKLSNTLTCVAPDLPEITETQLVYVTNCPNVTDDVKMEDRMERKGKHRSQLYVIKNGISDGEAPATSAFSQLDNETDDKVRNHRHSNTEITTAAEFSSESLDGPAEKLFRGETVLPTENYCENAIISMETVVTWDDRNFANSTVIGDDLGQQLMFQGTSGERVLAKNSLSDERPLAFLLNEEKIADQLALMAVTRGTNDMAMNLEKLNKSSFCIFKETIENLSNRSDIIWDINRLDEKIVAFNFFSKLIVVAIYLNENTDSSTKNHIKEVALLSQLVKEKTDPGVCLAHSLIMKKMSTKNLTLSCQTYEEIPQLLEYISTEVKLGMNFMFELDRLQNHNVMEIHDNRITFMARTRDINAGIILSIAIEVKSFEEINPKDITVSCLLGSEKIRKNDIERLITNVKRDHRFLRFYMTDVKDYIDLMAETGFSMRS